MASNPPPSPPRPKGGARGFLSKEFLGLPMWAWGIGLLATLAALVYFLRTRSSSGATSTGGALPITAGPNTGTFSGSGGTTSASSTSPSRLVHITPTLPFPTGLTSPPPVTSSDTFGNSVQPAPHYFAYANFEQALAAHEAGVPEFFSPAPGVYEPIDITQSHFSQPTPIFSVVPQAMQQQVSSMFGAAVQPALSAQGR